MKKLQALLDVVANDVPFKKKLNRIYLVFFIVPMLLISFFLTTWVTSLLEKQLQYSASANYAQTLQYLEAVLSSYDTLTFTLSRSEDFQYLYKSRRQIGHLSANEQDSLKRQVEKNVYTVISRTALKGFSFYFKDDVAFYSDDTVFFGYDEVQQQRWFDEITKYFGMHRRTFLVCPPGWLGPGDENTVAFARTIFSQDNYWNLFGLVRVDIPAEEFTEILRQNESIDGTVSYLVNYDGEVVASVGQLPGAEKAAPPLPYRDEKTESGWSHLRLAGQTWLVQQEPVGKYKLNLITLIPTSAISRESRNIQVLVFAVLLALGLLAGWLFARVFRSLIYRVQLIIGHMRNTNQGQPDPISEAPGKDELGQLIENYNLMVADIEGFAEYRYQSGLAMRNYELKVLQEQINPHFLYNTLEMVNWLARGGQNEKVSRAVAALAQFYRASLRGGSSTVSLGQELEHVRAYIELQNMRFEDTLQAQYSLPEDLLPMQVPRTILQPVVENAILHGILEKESGQGCIRIAATRQGDEVLLVVEDDGAGMPDDTVQALNALSGGGEAGSGYGISNVVRRIQLMYGTHYGLFYESGPQGTRATFKLPASAPEGGESTGDAGNTKHT